MIRVSIWLPVLSASLWTPRDARNSTCLPMQSYADTNLNQLAMVDGEISSHLSCTHISLPDGLYLWKPLIDATNYHTHGVIKKHTFTMLQFWRSTFLQSWLSKACSNQDHCPGATEPPAFFGTCFLYPRVQSQQCVIFKVVCETPVPSISLLTGPLPRPCLPVIFSTCNLASQ